jgi:hypothetical protein
MVFIFMWFRKANNVAQVAAAVVGRWINKFSFH